MKISVVMSAYNGAEYITEQLDSIRKQLRQSDEVLIFDDCSIDNTAKIVKEYIEKYELITWEISVNKSNLGWKKNFMLGMNQAKGDLIFSADQDDIWSSEKLDIMHRIMEENADINILASAVEEFFTDGHTNIIKEKSEEKLVRVNFSSKIFNIKYPGCTYCIRKSFFKECINMWRDKFPHDAFLWRNALVTDSLAVYNEPLIKWRKHTDSAFSIEAKKGKNKKEKIEWTFYAEDVIKQLINYVDLKKKIINNYENKTLIFEQLVKWIKLRRKFYETKNFIYGIKLLSYLNCYVRFKQYPGDWYITYFKGEK